MTKEYKTSDEATPMVSEPTAFYSTSRIRHLSVKPLPVQESIPLTDDMKASLHKAEQDLTDGNCLTEEKFQARFAKWL